ncbi:hypothetical protein JL722_2250 [Aureococcus anophagefferens]|nr:hypothetical protein JL722_2250 [Aureococcus anophagefferens]
MAGAGILAQPSVAHALGLGWWFVAWTAAMGISGYTMYLVSRSKISADEIAGPAPHTLSELTNKITKNARCARAVEALVCVLQMSFGVGYVVVMLSLVCRALVPSLARWAACLALAPLAGCLALIPDLNRLTLVSVFGLFVTVVGVVGLSGGYALTSDAFEVHLWGSAGPGTPSCSWGVLIRHVGSILYSVESVNHAMPNADMMADPTRLPRVIAIVMVSYWLFVGAWVALTDMAGFGKCPAAIVFTGLVGCLFLSLLGFILPVVLFETSASGHRGENAPLRSLAHVLIAVLGVILAIVGTGTSIVALRGGVSK